MNAEFNYKLETEKLDKAPEIKSVENVRFGTSFYAADFFYKYVTRCFLPAKSNEQS